MPPWPHLSQRRRSDNSQFKLDTYRPGPNALTQRQFGVPEARKPKAGTPNYETIGTVLRRRSTARNLSAPNALNHRLRGYWALGCSARLGVGILFI